MHINVQGDLYLVFMTGAILNAWSADGNETQPAPQCSNLVMVPHLCKRQVASY